MINPGEFNKRIKIVSLGDARDSDGYKQPARTEIHSCMAKFSRTSGTEAVKSGADFSDTKVRFLFRYTPKPISRKMVVEYAGADYEIEYINDYDDAHQYMEIIASRVAPGV